MKFFLILLTLFTSVPLLSFATCDSDLAANPVAKSPEYLRQDYFDQVNAEETMVYYSKNMNMALELTQKSANQTLSTFKRQLKKILKNKVPISSLERRLDILDKPTYSYGEFLWALGDMNLQEVNELTYGTDIEHPSPESLVGQYIAKTNAKILVKSFAKTVPITDTEAVQGSPKIFLPVSQETFPIYQKIFSQHNFMVNFGHAHAAQNGKVFSYQYSFAPLILPETPFTVMPHVALTSTEAQRLEQYSQLFKPPYWRGWAHDHQDFVGMYPWALTGYCGIGGYAQNCTQWLGNIPLGDLKVKKYAFPPNYEAGIENPKPITQKLKEYEHEDALVKRIWTVPGHQQLADMIGEGEANLRGEFANPGWVISTLIGPTTNQRVPIVLLVVEDVTKKIPKNFVPHFERPM